MSPFASADDYSAPMVFDFEDDDCKRLTFLPLAARRALDAAGLKLSLAAWQKLSLETRGELVTLGAMPHPDIRAVAVLLSSAGQPGDSVAVAVEPPTGAIPVAVANAVGERLTTREWEAMSPLSRYVCQKLSQKGDGERLLKVLPELIAGAHSSL